MYIWTYGGYHAGVVLPGKRHTHKEASLHNQLYHKHTVFPQYQFDTILKNDSFNTAIFLMPSTFYIPIHFSPTPHSQTMPFHILHSYSFLPHSQTMPFLLSVGLQYSHSAHHSNISAQQSAAFTHNVQYTTPYQ